VRSGDRLDLPLAESRHLARVLRRGPGDPVIVLAASGAFAAEIVEVREEGSESRVAVVVREPAAAGPPTLPWAAAVGLVKGEAFDLAVRMAAEVGLETLVPLVTRRSVARGAGPARAERWERIAREAAKQCGRVEPLRVAPIASLEAVLAEWRAGGARRGFIAVPGARLPLEALRGPDGEPAPALFLIGPEGGFAPEEVAAAEAAGLARLGFPTPVLRTPTAVALVGALGLVLAASQAPDRRVF
jgi:16S rRNA (uracil1498-N3)-methyltransferase